MLVNEKFIICVLAFLFYSFKLMIFVSLKKKLSE